eukprot:Skav208598  [mRNA]  locus=scaffold598:175888:179301:- [translate_table: standard]
MLRHLPGSTLRGGSNDLEEPQKNSVEKWTTCWTINVAGLRGFWRLIHLLEEMPKDELPEIILVQEMLCSRDEWKTTLRSIDAVGFRACPSEDVAMGTKKKGTVTLTKLGQNCRPLSESTTSNGCATAVIYNDLLVINNYCQPGEGCLAPRCAELHEWWIQLDWKGQTLMGGDWNGLPCDSWILTFAALAGLEVVPVQAAATRWEGKRVIDFFIHGMKTTPLDAEVRAERLSDHMIVETHCLVKVTGVDETHFKKHPTYTRPSWISAVEWDGLFDEAFELGSRSDWQEVCHLVAPSVPETNDDQHMVDFYWVFTCLRALWTLRKACYLALLMIPADFNNKLEVRRVTHLANSPILPRVSLPTSCKRSMPRRGSLLTMAQRKIRNKLNRCVQLRRHWDANRRDSRTLHMEKKIFQDHKPTPEGLDRMIREYEQTMNDFEETSKKERIDNWKSRMNDITARGNWLRKKFYSFFPSLQENTKDGITVSRNKDEASKILYRHWQSISPLDDTTVLDRSKELGEFLQQQFEPLKLPKDRPTVLDFQKVLRSIHGASGADGWDRTELQVIGRSTKACELFWDAMLLWETTGLTPATIKDVRLCYIPKEKVLASQCDVGSFRPITVFSGLWRAWSGTWMKSEQIKKIRDVFPLTMFGNNLGTGAEDLATIASAGLHAYGFGAALDFTQCFDTVSIRLMAEALSLSLPGPLKGWAACLFEQWFTSRRWLIYDRHVSTEPHCGEFGIPQGDPASPLILSLLMLYGSHCVKNAFPGDTRIMQVIYMDDRTILCEDAETMEEAIRQWSVFAQRFGLTENPAKTQRVCTHAHSQFPSFMEVLGCLVGTPSSSKFASHPKHRKRVDEARRLNRRISFLPLPMACKMQTVAIFTRAMASYGWIEGKPPDRLADRFNSSAWSSVGRISYSLKPLRTILGTWLEMEPAHFINVIRLKLRKDTWIGDLGLPPCSTGLDLLFLDLLEWFGWYLVDDTFHHQILQDTFDKADVHNKSKWKAAAHALRQSCRWKAYQDLETSQRHELQEGIPPFDQERVDAVRKIAASSGRSLALLLGAVKSGASKALTAGKAYRRNHCKKCGAINPGWNHLWECGLERKPPDDTLSRRFGWPQNSSDQKLHLDLLKGVEAVLGGSCN